MKSIITFIIAIPVVVGIAGAAIIYEAWILTKLWGWFVVPTFNMHQINMAMACGLAAFLSLVSWQDVARPENGEGTFASLKPIGRLIGTYTASLAVGYIAHLFI
jgi:hypothetical protein